MMNTKKMIQSIILLGVFWYCYLVYICMIELQLPGIFVILLSVLLSIFVRTLYPLLHADKRNCREEDTHDI